MISLTETMSLLRIQAERRVIAWRRLDRLVRARKGGASWTTGA
jgi:hypothetical protein